MIPRRAAAGPVTLMNFHNQGVTRAEYQGPRTGGFTVEFLSGKAAENMEQSLVQGVAVIRGSAISAVVSSTDELKQRMRSYLDSHFTGSAMHGNQHRRVSNASVQSVIYDDIAEKGQYTALIYSKFGYRGPGGFVDFLLLHIRGGTVRPKTGDWLRIPNPKEPSSRFGQAGFYPISGADIFFAESEDGKKLFQLRRQRGRSAKPTRLLATLVKSLAVQPSLQGLEVIMAQQGALFDRHFNAEFDRRQSGAE